MARPAGRKGRVDKGQVAAVASHEASRHEPGRWWLEPLEPRLLLSSLPIPGTAGDDTITVSQDLTGVTVTTQLDSLFHPGSFSTIEVYGLAGNDTIRLMHSVFADHSVYGGEGNDTVFDAATGAGQVDGGDGDDLLVTVGGGLQLLSGGTGSDSFWCDGSDTISDADYAESFRNVHVIQEFYQPYTTDPQSPNYVSLEINGQTLQDPSASGYKSFAGTPLFVDGPQYDDAFQGAVTDCYFISALASLAEAVPEAIEQTIAPLGDGTYAVLFHRNFNDYYVRVDADLPASGSTPTYAQLGADSELWVPLIEKAYAYFRYGQNSYISLAIGLPADVYSDITASDTTSILIGSWVAEATIKDFISTHLAAGHAISAPSLSNASFPIAVSHSYMVKSMRTVESTTYVMLYNPWGNLLEITLSQFKNNFALLTASLAGNNRFPVAVDDSAVTEVDHPVTINVIANDSDPEGDPLSLKSVGWPSHGRRQYNGNGTITYTPEAGFVGVDTFTYVLRDGNGGLAQGTVTVTVDGDAPKVSKVLVSSSSWSQAFLNALGDVGFAIPAGPSQLDALPWTNINRISMVFSENVNISRDNIKVYGLNVPEYAITAFDYDSVTRTATWTLSQSIAEGDLLRVVLSDAVVDFVGHRLDGEWTDATSTYPSGNGSSGGEFQMRINVLPGDADGNGTTGWGDLGVLSALFGGAAAGGKADFNGDGIVDAADFIMLKYRLGRSLPAIPQAPIAAPPVSGTVAPPAEISPDGQTGKAAATTPIVDDPTAVNDEPQVACKAASALAPAPSLELAAWQSLQCRAEAAKLSAGDGLSVPRRQGLPLAHSPWRDMHHDNEPIDVLRISRAGAKVVAGPFTGRSIGPAFAETEQAGSGDALRHIVSLATVPAPRLRVLLSALETSMLTVLAQPGLDIL
jgi:hypothetical protein